MRSTIELWKTTRRSRKAPTRCRSSARRRTCARASTRSPLKGTLSVLITEMKWLRTARSTREQLGEIADRRVVGDEARLREPEADVAQVLGSPAAPGRLRGPRPGRAKTLPPAAAPSARAVGCHRVDLVLRALRHVRAEGGAARLREHDAAAQFGSAGTSTARGSACRCRRPTSENCGVSGAKVYVGPVAVCASVGVGRTAWTAWTGPSREVAVGCRDGVAESAEDASANTALARHVRQRRP